MLLAQSSTNDWISQLYLVDPVNNVDGLLDPDKCFILYTINSKDRVICFYLSRPRYLSLFFFLLPLPILIWREARRRFILYLFTIHIQIFRVYLNDSYLDTFRDLTHRDDFIYKECSL